MRNNKLKLTPFDASKKTIELDGNNDSQNAFFKACRSRKLNFSVLFLCMKITIMVPTVAVAATWEMPRADAFSIPVANAEEGEALHSQLQEVIQSLNSHNASYGVLPSVCTTLPLCTAPAASTPTGVDMSNNSVLQDKWHEKAKSTPDNTIERL